MEAAMPCNISRNKHRETCRSTDHRKTKFACIVEADESTRKRLEGSLPKDQEDHITGKGINSLDHYNLVHKFIPTPKPVNILETKAAVDKEKEKLEKNLAWQLTESQN